MMTINAGFLPLVDAAILIVAREKGFAEEAGIDIRLHRETSWANVRDRLSVGHFDVAHMLAPLPIAQNLGLSPLRERLIVPFALGLGGNAITVSNILHRLMSQNGHNISSGPALAGAALKTAIDAFKTSTGRVPIFAVVHDYSAHAYELRYWLASCGIDPTREVEVTIVPPSFMADALLAGSIDGFCVGEPWNSVAVHAGIGHVVATKSDIWQSSPEKVLAVRESYAEERSQYLEVFLKVLHESATWAAQEANREELAALLSAPEYLGVDAALIMTSLAGNVMPNRTKSDFMMFADRAANFPWQSHALWFYSQMVRWMQVSHSKGSAEIARTTYRPDIYRRALSEQGVPLPGASAKVEGALDRATTVPAKSGPLTLGPDGFFDHIKFDPDDIESYLKQLSGFAAVHKN